MWSFGRYVRHYIGARLLYNLARAAIGMVIMAGGLWATRQALQDPASIPGKVSRLVEAAQTLRGSMPAPTPEVLRPTARPKPTPSATAAPAAGDGVALGARVLLAAVALTLYLGAHDGALVSFMRGLSLLAGVSGLAVAGSSEMLVLSLGLLGLPLIQRDGRAGPSQGGSTILDNHKGAGMKKLVSALVLFLLLAATA